MDRICQVLGEGLRTVRFVLPYDQAQVQQLLYRDANVRRADFAEDGIHMEVTVDRKTYGRIRDLLPENEREPEDDEF